MKCPMLAVGVLLVTGCCHEAKAPPSQKGMADPGLSVAHMPAVYAKAVAVVMEDRRTDAALHPADQVLENYEVSALLRNGAIIVYVEIPMRLVHRVRGEDWTYSVDPTTYRIKEKYRQR